MLSGSCVVAIYSENEYQYVDYRECTVKKLGELDLHILTLTLCVMDRLAGFYHWNDRQNLDQAVMFARRLLVVMQPCTQVRAENSNPLKRVTENYSLVHFSGLELLAKNLSSWFVCVIHIVDKAYPNPYCHCFLFCKCVYIHSQMLYL